MNVVIKVLNGTLEHNRLVLSIDDDTEFSQAMSDILEFLRESKYEMEDEL